MRNVLRWSVAHLAVPAVVLLGTGCVETTRPSFSGVVSGPQGKLAHVKIAVCMMRPHRGVKCNRIETTQTDAQGRFAFGSVWNFGLSHNLESEGPLTLITVCHPDAARLQVALQPDIASSPSLRVYDAAFFDFRGFDIRSKVTPESICNGPLDSSSM